ncbi:MAG: DsrE family protein [Bacteroidetes bacterium]|nr:DsrE family protein [Bacteroidota bacterium]
MKTNFKLFAIIILLSTFSAFSQKQASYKCPDDEKAATPKSEHKIVFQLTTNDTLAHKALMKQLTNIKSVAPETKIEVVCHGPGLDMLVLGKTTVLKGIQSAKEKGVEFMACEFSMKERKVDKESIIKESGFVAAGIIEIVSKQEQGWSYIKSGF